MPLRRLKSLETELAHLDAEVAQRSRPQPAVLTAMATIPGVGQRTGANRAAVAVAHSIAVIRHHISRTRQPYADLGHYYFEQHDQAALTRRAVRQLERLGTTSPSKRPKQVVFRAMTVMGPPPPLRRGAGRGEGHHLSRGDTLSCAYLACSELARNRYPEHLTTISRADDV